MSPPPPPPPPPPLSPPTPDWLLLILAAFAWIWDDVILAAFAWIWDDANFNKLMKLATLFGGGIGLYFLYIRTRAADSTAWAALKQAETTADQARIAADRHEEQTRADRDRRITESFAKAVEQLGSDKQIATRLGGIYTLERISGESEREYWPIIGDADGFRARARAVAVAAGSKHSGRSAR